MRTLQRTIWCLSGLLLLSSAVLAQNRPIELHAVDRWQTMQDRIRAIRLSLSNPTASLSKLPTQVEQANQEGLGGDNFVNIIPCTDQYRDQQLQPVFTGSG